MPLLKSAFKWRIRLLGKTHWENGDFEAKQRMWCHLYALMFQKNFICCLQQGLSWGCRAAHRTQPLCPLQVWRYKRLTAAASAEIQVILQDTITNLTEETGSMSAFFELSWVKTYMFGGFRQQEFSPFHQFFEGWSLQRVSTPTPSHYLVTDNAYTHASLSCTSDKLQDYIFK